MTPGGPPTAPDVPDDMADDRAAGATSRRPSRWDLAPEPHDWRWAVGWLGRILVSVGVLLFAFVAYQLWGTGIQTAQAQNRLEREFEELQSATTTAAPTTVATTVAPVTTLAPVDVTSPSTAAPTTTSSTVPPAAISAPPLGDPLARLTIDSIGLDKILIEGVRPSDLEDGPGHFPETPLPGQLGNAAIAGHRTTHGAPFLRIDEVDVGDDIVVETLAGTYTYVVTGQQIVNPGDYQLVIPTIDPSVATLTLTSCHPPYSTRERIVVTAVVDPARSDVITERSVVPIDPALLPGGSDLPDEGTVAPTSTEAAPDTTAIGVATTNPPATSPATTPATTDPLGAADDGEGPGTAGSQELFENRWFSDPGANADVALWGLVLMLLSVGATALSRRMRNNWVGALTGIVPFVLALYFWFENVNRLLPPNL